MIRIAVSILIFLAAPRCFAGLSLGVDSGLLYSSLSDQGANSFALLPKKGSKTQGELAITYNRWDLVFTGEQSEINLIAPAGQTVNDSELMATSMGGGMRYKWPSMWLALSYDMIDSLYLENTAANVYNMKKASVSFASLDLRITATNRRLSVTVDGKASFPLNQVDTISGPIKYSYVAGAGARVDWGQKFRAGFVGSVQQHKYMVGSDGYYRTDIFLGLSLGLNFGNARSNPSAGRASNGSVDIIPSYPID